MIISRDVLNALLPPGQLWSPEDEGDLYKLLDGIGDNHDAMVTVLENLAYVRNPDRTTMLADLEREFGIIPDDSIQESVRRSRIKAAKLARNGSGSLSFLETCLQQAGFDVHVYENNPAVDPSGVILSGSSTIMGEPSAYFGESYFGAQNSTLIVNGPLMYNEASVSYDVPATPGYWPLVSFIGGDVTRDVDGSILTLGMASVPFSRSQEFVRMILRLKPMHSWIGMRVQYT